MTADAAVSLATLARLRASLEADLGALERHATIAGRLLGDWEALRGDPAQRAYAAATLHGWYTGLETALERVARAIDGATPTGADWHRELLRQASVELSGLRPAVLAPRFEPQLLGLLSFRHFFRNAYAVDLDPQRLAENLRHLEVCAADVHQALRAFRDFVLASERTLASPQ